VSGDKFGRVAKCIISLEFFGKSDILISRILSFQIPLKRSKEVIHDERY